MLKSREPDVQDRAGREPELVGQGGGQRHRDRLLGRSSPTPTRTAALLSGEVDLVLDPPHAGHRRACARTPRSRSPTAPRPASSSSASTSGATSCRTPTSRARTRSRTSACARRCTRRSTSRRSSRASMRGLVGADRLDDRAAGQRLLRGIREAPALRRRPRRKKLLADAGYPDGFEFTLDCPNNRYINDEEICMAIAAMWAQDRPQGEAQRDAARDLLPEDPEVRHQRLPARLGDGDLRRALHAAEPDPHADGGRRAATATSTSASISNPKVDALIDQVKTEIDDGKRNEMMREALQIHTDDVGHIPLHQQVIPWAMRTNVIGLPPRRQPPRQAAG